LVKWNFTTVGISPPSFTTILEKNFWKPPGKIHYSPPLVKNPSDVCERCDNIISMFIDT